MTNWSKNVIYVKRKAVRIKDLKLREGLFSHTFLIFKN